jgi:death-on-curing protein
VATKFIPEELVLTIHADLLQRYGGQPGLRDRGLLESALAQPRMTFRGKEVHKTVFDKAAAYGFHVCNNHPFIDGNKRVAFVLMDLFLQKNGWEIRATEEEVYLMMISLASEKLTKSKLSIWLKEHTARVR